MKKWLFILATLSAAASQAQEVAPCPEFKTIMRDAEKAAKARDFRNAILRYNAAKRCNPAESAEIDRRVIEVFDEIEQLRKQAESAQRAAEREKQSAQQEARKARAAEARAETLRDQAEQAIDKMTLALNKADEETLRAERKAVEAKSAALAAKAQRTQWENPTLALRLAEAAFEMYPGDDARDAMDDILSDPEAIFYTREFLNGAPVKSVAYSPDGSTLLAGDTEGMCKIWNLEGEALLNIQAHQKQVMKVAFSPDGQYFLSAGIDTLVHLWTVKGQLVRTFKGHASYLWDVAFSPKGDRIVSCSEDGTAIIWSVNGQQLHQLKGHTEGVTSVAFSPNGQYIATGSSDKKAILWDSLGQVVSSYQSDGSIFSLSFFQDGEHILLASGKPKVWNYKKNLTSELDGTYTPISNSAASPDGITFAFNNMIGNSADLWQIGTVLSETGEATIAGRKWLTLNGHTNEVSTIAFSPDQRTLATASRDGSIKVWDIYGNLSATYGDHKGYVRAVAFSLNGTKIATADNDGIGKISDLRGNILSTLSGHTAGIRDIAFSPNEQQVLTGSEDHSAILWSLDGKQLAKLVGHRNEVLAVAFSRNGDYLLTASADSTARVWDASGQLVFTFSKHRGEVSDIQALPDGEYFMTSSWDGTVRRWNMKSEEKMVFRPESDGVRAFAISPDNATIAAITSDKAALIWNIADPKTQQEIKLPGIASYDITFTVDGQYVITSGWEGVMLWDLRGRKVASIRSEKNLAAQIACSPDGNFLLTPDDKQAKLWLLPSVWLKNYIAPMREEDIIAYGIREFLKNYGR